MAEMTRTSKATSTPEIYSITWFIMKDICLDKETELVKVILQNEMTKRRKERSIEGCTTSRS